MAADAPEVREAEQDGLLAVNAGGDYGAGDVRLIDQPSECGRKMEASPQAHGMYYRRPARTLAPGSPALASHPPAVYLREDPIREAVNSWIGRLFDRTNVDRTVTALVASQDGAAERGGYEAAKKRLADAEARLRRFQAAIASGVDPAALVDVIDDAQAQRAAARAELDGAPAPNLLTDAEVYAMIDSLGDVAAASLTRRRRAWRTCMPPSTCRFAASQRRTPPMWASAWDDG